MTDDAKTAPTNGNGKEVAKQVAANLYKLADELSSIRKQGESQEIRLIGLAKVLERGVPFSTEQADKICSVLIEAGDDSHAAGSAFYERAGKIAKAAKGQ